jgi:hypothetical protein
MNMKTLSNNAELHQYLQFLWKTLEERHAKELSEAVAHASRMSPFMSTEFLGESRIALRRLIKEGRGVLTSQERDDPRDVLSQIDAAFDRKRDRA